MMARRFMSVVWVAGIGGAALSCYILSSKVAEERSGLAVLEAQIAKAERSIQVLKTEIGTRGRVHQLNHWASADFGYAAPTAQQFVEDEVRLASLQAPPATPVTDAPIQMAAAPIVEASEPRVVQAAAPAARPQREAVRQASAPVENPALLRRAAAPAAGAAIPAVARTPREVTPVAPRRGSALVSANTLRDLDSRARSERGPERTSRQR